jgi:putative endonuclease
LDPGENGFWIVSRPRHPRNEKQHAPGRWRDGGEHSLMLYWLQKIFGFGPPIGAGERGEQAAAAWLVRERGFSIVARNWRNPRDRRDELDLVCRDGAVLVFVEVKARAPGALVPGFYAVDARKKRVLRRTIVAYLRTLREKPRTFRFDVVEVSTGLPDTGSSGASRAGRAPVAKRALVAVASPPEANVLHFENVPLFPKHFQA